MDPMVRRDNRQVINLVNKLQVWVTHTGCDHDINIPQIVVVGSQSAGKSSVLDGLIGFSLLPRGTGTVTKCPIIVQLTTSTDGKEGVEFQDDPEAQLITDFDLVHAKLLEKMEATPSITDNPIIVRVFSPSVPNLTVVDLPGIKRLGSKDVDKDTMALSEKYVARSNAIILAVSAANGEITVSDGLFLAQKADPEGKRTIGVLTKLDLLERATDVRDILTGAEKNIKVKLGMVGLVNRSQEDIENNVSIEMTVQKEKFILEENYPDLAHLNGIVYLRRRLNELLVQHILECLPGMQGKMEVMLKDCIKRVSVIPRLQSDREKRHFIDKITSNFENKIRKEVEGSVEDLEHIKPTGGIRIKNVFQQEFPNFLEESAKGSIESLTNSMILTAFQNSEAYDSIFENPEGVLKALIKYHLKLIEEPSLKCVNRIYNEIHEISCRNLAKEQVLDFFPSFRMTLKMLMEDMIVKNSENVEHAIVHYIGVQSVSLFTLDKSLKKILADERHNIEKELQALNLDLDKAKDKGKDESGVAFFPRLEKSQTSQLIKKMATIYINYLMKQCQDYIPKLISFEFISFFSSGGLGVELRKHLYDLYDKNAGKMENDFNVHANYKSDLELKQNLEEAIIGIKEILGGGSAPPEF